MKDLTKHASTGQSLGYWVTTGLLAAMMLGGGAAQLLPAQVMREGFQHLGYPPYATRLIGSWKMLGVLVLLIPGYGLVKEWAYAGFFFLLTGAVVSHLASGDAFQQWATALTGVLLTVASWYWRPASRRR